MTDFTLACPPGCTCRGTGPAIGDTAVKRPSPYLLGAAVGLVSMAAAVFGGYAWGDRNDPAPAEFYPVAAQLDDPGSTYHQAMAQQARCQGLTGEEWQACHDEYWRLYTQFRAETVSPTR